MKIFRNDKSNKGFSLVELLAVIVILGLLATIGIVATTSLVDKAKKDKMESQKNTVTMSAQTYMQNNKNLVPKIIGETRILNVSDLRKSNYLTDLYYLIIGIKLWTIIYWFIKSYKINVNHK